MMKYSNYISIGEQFKNSVNIEYDLLNFEKLGLYIPTEDICEVLSYYFNSIMDNSFNRSTILEGPYGKGKSYLVLTLLQLLLLDSKEKNVKSFLKKLKDVNIELFNRYLDIKESGKKLLPVIINSNYVRLPQALNVALKDALYRVGLNELFPNTAYEVSLSVIEQWKNDVEIDKKVLEKCIEKTGSTLNNLERGIKDYNVESFNKFVELYNCIVKGLSFNPFASDDVVKNYSDISYKLEDYGYTGIFIVFDEFSKFIESDNDDLPKDLKVLQDLSEMVNRSGNIGQMHLCCITHKSLSSYYKNKKETTINLFRTVEGRFKEVRFNRSLNQNYQIISMTLIKKKGFNSFYENQFKKNKEFYDNVSDYEIFNDINHDLVFKGCFPLNPLTTFAVVNISEMIAQNERTLFTFISDNDTNSLSTFIKNSDEGLFNVDKIYDYFYNLLGKTDEEEIRKLNYKAQICLSKVGDNLSKRIIKVLTIIKIIGNDSFAPTISIISSCLNVKESEVSIALNSLMNKKLLKKSFATEYYDFALSSSKIIDAKVDAFLISKAKNENLSLVLNKVFDSEFVLPRKYNARHKMTRFYRRKYIADFELMNINSFDFFFNKEFCDGIIFDVLNTGIGAEEIRTHFSHIKSNETVILRLTDKEIDTSLRNEIFRIDALQSILLEKDLDEIVKDETKLIIAEETTELEQLLFRIYSKDNTELVSVYDTTNYFELLSNVMEHVYSCTPIVNNEMINKEQNVSLQYIKARNIVVNLYLEKCISKDQNELIGFTPTSPESTVFNSIKETSSIEKRTILDSVKKFLNLSEGNKQCASNIIIKLRKSPYGVRSGVLPLIFAMAISELDDNVLFYFDRKEIDLTAENLNKMIAKPDRYYFSLEKGSTEKTEYLYGLLNIFDLKTTNNYRDDIKLAVTYIQKWLMSLPRIIRSQSKASNFIKINQDFIEVKKIFTIFNINEHEALFEKLPAVFDNDYKKVIEMMTLYKKSCSRYIQSFATNLAKQIKELLNANYKSSLISAFEDWIKETGANQRVLENKEKDFLSIFVDKDYDDLSVINKISKNLVHTNLMDWERDNSIDILSFIENLCDSIKDRKMISEIIDVSYNDLTEKNNEEMSVMGNLLKNNVEEVFDEFGDSVSNEEKIKILTKLIGEMM